MAGMSSLPASTSESGLNRRTAANGERVPNPDPCSAAICQDVWRDPTSTRVDHAARRTRNIDFPASRGSSGSCGAGYPAARLRWDCGRLTMEPSKSRMWRVPCSNAAS